MAEVLRQLAVDGLGNERRLAQQFAGPLGIELRVGSQEGQKSLEAILPFRRLEAHLIDDGFHLRTDALHFCEANGMHAVRRGIGQGREIAHEVRVVRLSAGKVGSA